jgi:hypothetical protein
MALDNLSDTASDTYIGGNFNMMWFEAGDSTMKCGLLVECDETAAEEITVNAVNTEAFGVLALQADLDIDTAVTSGKTYSIYLLHSGTMLYLQHEDDAGTLYKGQICRDSIDGDAGRFQSGSTAGHVIGWSLVLDGTAQGDWEKMIT